MIEAGQEITIKIAEDKGISEKTISTHVLAVVNYPKKQSVELLIPDISPVVHDDEKYTRIVSLIHRSGISHWNLVAYFMDVEGENWMEIPCSVGRRIAIDL